MKIIIVGGSETGLALANILGGDNDITLIEKKTEKANALANKTSALVINGDGSDISILNEAGLKEADALVVTTTDDKTNLMVCTIAKSEEVKKIIALVNSTANEDFFNKLGIANLVSVVSTNVTGIIRSLHRYGNSTTIAQLGKGDMQIIEMNIPPKSRLIEEKARIPNATIITIYRKNEIIIPDETTVFKKNDTVIAIVKTENLQAVATIIAGK